MRHRHIAALAPLRLVHHEALPLARALIGCLCAVLCLSNLSGNAGEAAQQAPEQSIFIGVRTCPDTAMDCSFTPVTARHRFLHVVLFDVPRSYEWRVQAGPTCLQATDLARQEVVGQDGYLEVVVDLVGMARPLLFMPSCYIFRGAEGWDARYYAAYFDDTGHQDADSVYPGFRLLNGVPDLSDLDVAFISRGPAMAYDAPKQLPAVGDTVVFGAHVINSGFQSAGNFSYEWLVDQRLVSAGTITSSLPPGDSTVIFLDWKWKVRPASISFRITPTQPEISANNNALTVFSIGLSLGFWVEKSAYQYFQRHQWLFCLQLECAGSNSFDDWLQRQVAAWNGILADSTYPDAAPSGVADRIRLDKVVVVPDGSLPLTGSAATNGPDVRDRTVDLEWGLPAKSVEKTYQLHRKGNFNVDWPMIHELNHARSLADLYRFDVPLRSDSEVNVTDSHGRSAVDPANPYAASADLPAFTDKQSQGFLFENGEQDLMSCVCAPHYSLYSVLVLNRLRNRRARCGNTNPPCNMGDWFSDIPPVNHMRLILPDGSRAPDGTVIKLYFDTGQSYVGHRFMDADSLALRVEHGIVTLPRDPFHETGATWPPGHNLLLFDVIGASSDTFCFQEPSTLNLAYWSGYRDRSHPATFTLRVGRGPHNECRLAPPSARINEPFGTSPYASRLRVRRHQRDTILALQLMDDQTPPVGMAARRVRILDMKGNMVVTGTTDRSGRLVLRVPLRYAHIKIADETDNWLDLTSLLQSQTG